MPYKRDGSDAPENVRELPAKKRRQWTAVWNGVYEKCTTDGGEAAACERAAFAQANGVVMNQKEVAMPDNAVVEVTKTVAGEQYPASDFLVVEDPESPTTWHLQVKKNGTPDRGLAGAAWAALFNPSGYRGNKYEGPEKVAAQEKLKALYSAEEWDMPTEETEQAPVKEMDVADVLKLLQAAMDALKAMGAPAEEPGDTEPEPEAPTEEPMESAETFTESSAPLALVEVETPVNRRAPLTLDVGIIKVGPGNQRDNNYYTREMLERDGGVFKGAKMYATDHRNDEKSVRTEVSIVSDVTGVKEFEDGEYLTGRVTVFNPDFAEDVRNRADAKVLKSLHCSILARGEATPGKVGENEYNIVQKITEAQSVDWVTRAGAGGHALGLAESAAEPEPETVETQENTAEEVHPVTLSEDAQSESEVIPSLPLTEVVSELGKTNLPAASVAELAKGQYTNNDELRAAVSAEVTRLKAAGSGQPIGNAPANRKQAPTLAEIQAEQRQVNQKWLGGY